MKILVAGTPQVAVPTLTALAKGTEHEVVAVLTREDAPVGRKRIMTPSNLAVAATDLGIPVIKANKVTPEVDKALADTGAEIAVVIAYGALLRQRTLDLFPHGWINLHFSSLPAWRGAAPVQHAILAGDTPAVSVFSLVAELDAGPIWAADEYPLLSTATAGKQLEELSQLGVGQVLTALSAVSSGKLPTEQPSVSPTPYAAKLQRKSGYLSVQSSVADVLRRWRAYTPEPGAFFELDGQPLKAIAMQGFSDIAPVNQYKLGDVILHNKHALLLVSDGVIELTQVQPQGKKVIKATDWLRGRHEQTRFA